MAENVPIGGTPPTPIEQEKSSFLDTVASPFGIITLFVLLLIFSIAAYFLARNPTMLQKITGSLTVAPTVTPIPTPRYSKPLPAGKQIYKISHGSGVKGPKLQEVTIEPLTPAVGETQTVTATIKHESPVTEASLILESDTQTNTFPLKLISGTTTDGTWQGSWQMPEAYLYNYFLKFSLKSATGDYNDGLKLR